MTSSADTQADVPERIGHRYRVHRALGHGGMASVYEAVDELTGKRVAVKQLNAAKAAADGRLTRLFELEFHTLRQLAHPRVVEVYDYQNQDDGAFYTMELLDGGDLREHQGLPWRTVCALLCDVCSALSLLHSRRFVHRDVTPRNIRRTQDGKAKLIDFGAMVSFGTHKHLIGTPAFTAPEAATGQELDGRADLFSVGATAYYALTGRHAYPARSFNTLRNTWRTQPAVPSRYSQDIPAGLDQLVMSLLSLSPSRRPASAAAVIERLTAIAGLELDEQLLVQRSFLSTPGLVGRDGVLQQIRRQVILAARGRGGTLFLTGARGVGLSRMVDACALETKLASGMLLRADAADAQDGEWGGVRSLLEQLLTELPAHATELITAHAACLAHVWPRAATLAGIAELTVNPEPGRGAVHDALLTLMGDVTRHGLLVVTADDLDRLDEPTRAFIALLAQQVTNRRMLVVTAAASEAVAAGIRGLQLLRREDSTITLQPLTLAETERLLISMFGDVPNVRLVASKVHEVSHGLPTATMQLCQYMLEQELVHLRDGGWILPSALDSNALPSSVTQALRARIARLDAASRSLGEAIALTDQAALTLDQCRALMAEADRPTLLLCLDALAAAEIIRVSGERYALSQPLWSTLLKSELDVAHERLLHGRIAVMLANDSDSEFRTAGHLLACGQASQAIELLLMHLQKATRRLHDDPAWLPEHIGSLPSNWLHTLEMAIVEGDRLGLPRVQRLTLRLLLLQRLSITNDPRCELALEAVQQLHGDSGLLDYAQIGDTVAADERLHQALARAQSRYEAAPEAERCLPVGEAIKTLVRLYVELLGMVGGSADGAFLAALPSLAPFAPLSPAIRLVQRNVESTCHLFAGRVEQAYTGYREILASMNMPEATGLTPPVHRYMKLAVTFTLAFQEVIGGITSAALRIDELMRDPLFEVNAWHLRMVWALRQGNIENADRCARQSELLKIRSSPGQFFEGASAWQEVIAFAEIGDVARIRATLDGLDAAAQKFRPWRTAPMFARGQIQLLRGDAVGAVSTFEAALAEASAGEIRSWAQNARGLVRALTEAGRVDEARARGGSLLQQALAAGLTVQRVDLHIALAYAELAAGDCAAAQLQLNALDEVRERWPLGDAFGGACHELRARIALRMGDSPKFESAAQQCNALFSRSRNPILMDRCQRLFQDAERAGMRRSRGSMRAPAEISDTTAATDQHTIQASLPVDLSELDGFEQRARHVLRLVRERAATRHVMLYLLREQRPTLVVATADCPALARVETLVSQFLAEELALSAPAAIDPDDVMTTTVDNSAWTAATGVQFVPALLSHTVGDRCAVTGVLVFALEGNACPSDQLLSALSSALTAANDVVPMIVEASKASAA